MTAVLSQALDQSGSTGFRAHVGGNIFISLRTSMSFAAMGRFIEVRQINTAKSASAVLSPHSQSITTMAARVRLRGRSGQSCNEVMRSASSCTLCRARLRAPVENTQSSLCLVPSLCEACLYYSLCL